MVSPSPNLPIDLQLHEVLFMTTVACTPDTLEPLPGSTINV